MDEKVRKQFDRVLDHSQRSFITGQKVFQPWDCPKNETQNLIMDWEAELISYFVSKKL